MDLTQSQLFDPNDHYTWRDEPIQFKKSSFDLKWVPLRSRNHIFGKPIGEERNSAPSSIKFSKGRALPPPSDRTKWTESISSESRMPQTTILIENLQHGPSLSTIEGLWRLRISKCNQIGLIEAECATVRSGKILCPIKYGPNAQPKQLLMLSVGNLNEWISPSLLSVCPICEDSSFGECCRRTHGPFWIALILRFAFTVFSQFSMWFSTFRLNSKVLSSVYGESTPEPWEPQRAMKSWKFQRKL